MSVHMHYHIIGQNISEHRHALRLTQEQLAERAGICTQFLSRLERGKGVPSIETVMALCDAMDIEPGCLLTRSATHDANPPCRLRSDGGPDDPTVQAPADPSIIVISPDDLPILDLELPDTDLDA